MNGGRMRKMMAFCLLLLLFCGGNENDKIRLSEKEFIEIYCDVVSRSDLLPPAERGAFVDSVLKAHNTSIETFDNSIQHYRQNPEQWKELFEDVVAELERRYEKLGGPPPGEQPFSRSVKK